MTLVLPIRTLSNWHSSQYPPRHIRPSSVPSLLPSTFPFSSSCFQGLSLSHCRCFPFSFLFPFFSCTAEKPANDNRRTAIHYVASEFSRTIGCQRGLVFQEDCNKKGTSVFSFGFRAETNERDAMYLDFCSLYLSLVSSFHSYP